MRAIAELAHQHFELLAPDCLESRHRACFASWIFECRSVQELCLCSQEVSSDSFKSTICAFWQFWTLGFCTWGCQELLFVWDSSLSGSHSWRLSLLCMSAAAHQKRVGVGWRYLGGTRTRPALVKRHSWPPLGHLFNYRCSWCSHLRCLKDRWNTKNDQSNLSNLRLSLTFLHIFVHCHWLVLILAVFTGRSRLKTNKVYCKTMKVIKKRNLSQQEMLINQSRPVMSLL